MCLCLCACNIHDIICNCQLLKHNYKCLSKHFSLNNSFPIETKTKTMLTALYGQRFGNNKTEPFTSQTQVKIQYNQ